MQHADEVALLERVLALLDERTTHMVERSSEAAVARYFEPAALERERALFAKLPLMVGHASRLARDGDFFTHDDSGVPLLLTREKAFLNVCRHRGTRVECEAEGRGKRAFTCPYHGWSYQLDGRLLHIPHEEGFCDVERAQLGLTEIAHDRAAGFVWATATPGLPCRAGDHLGAALVRELEGFEFDQHVVYRPTRFRKAFNWKIGVEIFFEAYHVKRTHANSIYPIFIDNVALFDWFAPHMRNMFPKRSISELRDIDKANWRLRPHGNLLYFLFPNTLILVQPDHASVFNLYPRGTDETDIVFYTLIPESPANEKQQRYWDKNIDILQNAFSEDMAMGESIQRGLRSGANRAFHFGRYEQSLEFFKIEVERAIERLNQ